jgi:predicted ATP-binding protein involved in virulence
VKYCSILKKQQQSTPASYVGTPAKKAYQHKVSNVFMLLESDSEEGEDEADMTTIKKPVLDYANIIRIAEQVQVQIEATSLTVPQIPRVFGKSRWLDVVSSSDEEDESDEE